MFKYVIWDGKSPINNVPSEKVLEREYLKNNLGDIFYITNEYGLVSEICIGINVKSAHKMPIDYTLEQVAKEYVDNMNIGGESSTPLGNMNLIKEQEIKIGTLKKENEELKVVSMEQDKLLIETMYKVAALQNSKEVL